MKNVLLLTMVCCCVLAMQSCSQEVCIPPVSHPDSGQWGSLFSENLSNAVYPAGVWTFEDGVLTASEDQCIWTEKDYDNFIIDLEFKTDDGTNSGVIVYCTDIKNWIPNAVEIQIADDFAEKWAKADKTWHCGAVFGHLGASKSMVKRPGLWNRYTITCKDKMIYVMLNGEQVTVMNMSLWTSGKKNPDGTDIPPWMPKAFAKLPTHGHIGFQGKHAGAPIYFRNLKIMEIE